MAKHKAKRTRPSATTTGPAIRPEWIAFGCFALAVLVFYWIPLTDPNTTPQWDTIDYHYGVQKYFAAELAEFRLPAWSDFAFSGYPFLADPQVGVWYPLNWPFFLMGITPKALMGEIALHALLALAGTWLLARRYLGKRSGGGGGRLLRLLRLLRRARHAPGHVPIGGLAAVAALRRRPLDRHWPAARHAAHRRGVGVHVPGRALPIGAVLLCGHGALCGGHRLAAAEVEGSAGHASAGSRVDHAAQRDSTAAHGGAGTEFHPRRRTVQRPDGGSAGTPRAVDAGGAEPLRLGARSLLRAHGHHRVLPLRRAAAGPTGAHRAGPRPAALDHAGAARPRALVRLRSGGRLLPSGGAAARFRGGARAGPHLVRHRAGAGAFGRSRRRGAGAAAQAAAGRARHRRGAVRRPVLLELAG